MFGLRRIVLVVLIGISVAGASLIVPVLDDTRSRLGRSSFAESEQKPPAITLLTHLLGGFKGLLVDAVWLRAVTLQYEEKYWELYQLYEWMGQLEPHIEEIWVFNGWNMSYNLVAELPSSEARWQWIRRGLELLRNKGLKYNPKSGQIMKEISWIFHHKIGRNVDLHHFYYKNRWATAMDQVMGPRGFQNVPGLWYMLKYTVLRDTLERARRQSHLPAGLLQTVIEREGLTDADSATRLLELARKTLKNPDGSPTLEGFFAEALKISYATDVLKIYFKDSLSDFRLRPSLEELFKTGDDKAGQDELFWKFMGDRTFSGRLRREFGKLAKEAAAPDTLKVDFQELLNAHDVKATLGRSLKLDPPEPVVKALMTVPGIRTIPPRIAEVLFPEPAGPGQRRSKEDLERAYNVRQMLFDFVAARVLYTDYRMRRFDVMFAIERKLGRFDWRLPEPHSMYWAQLAGLTDIGVRRQIDYDRLALHSVQETMRRGILAYFDPDNPRQPAVTLYDLSKIPRIEQLYKDLMGKYSVDRDDRGADSVRHGHMQWLQEIVFQLYFSGDKSQSLKYYRQLNKQYDKPRPRVPLDDYCLGRVQRLVDEYGTEAKIRAFLDGIIWEAAYLRCVGRFKDAEEREDLAKRAWRAYTTYEAVASQGKGADEILGKGGEADEKETDGESKTKGSDKPRHGKLPPYREILRQNLQYIIDGKIPFPGQYIPILREMTGLKKRDDKELGRRPPPERVKTPDSSPGPK